MLSPWTLCPSETARGSGGGAAPLSVARRRLLESGQLCANSMGCSTTTSDVVLFGHRCDVLWVFGGLEPVVCDSDEDESDFMQNESNELWAYCTPIVDSDVSPPGAWRLAWRDGLGEGPGQDPRLALGPTPCCHNAELLTWWVDGRQVLLLYNPDEQLARAEHDSSFPAQALDRLWIYDIAQGLWTVMRTVGPGPSSHGWRKRHAGGATSLRQARTLLQHSQGRGGLSYLCKVAKRSDG